ncbi:MAG: hypothetical protein MUF36_05215 [Bacteroidales bacterium]|nr:hypothetical protein [Bacteroidales bacterium]
MKKMLINKIWFICLPVLLISCEKNESDLKPDGGFISFSSNGQTILSTAINNGHQQ